MNAKGIRGLSGPSEGAARVYWKRTSDEDLSFDDAITLEDAKTMKEEIERAGFYQVLIVLAEEASE